MTFLQHLRQITPIQDKKTNLTKIQFPNKAIPCDRAAFKQKPLVLHKYCVLTEKHLPAQAF